MLRAARTRLKLTSPHNLYLSSKRVLSDVAHQRKTIPTVTTTQDSISRKRVFGIAAHIDAGKTTTCEAILHASGTLGRSRIGRVDRGDTALDFLPAERERGITIQSASATFDWRDHQVFLVDSPGHLDFSFEVERALRVMDAVIVLVDAVAGVQPQTEAVWRQANRANLPRLLVVNKMDRIGARLDEVVAECAKHFQVSAPLTQLPLTKPDGEFAGVLDLVTMRMRTGEEIPENVQLDEFTSQARLARERLVEAVADIDDNIMSLYLDEASVPSELLRDALRKGCTRRDIVPVLCAAALKDVGVREIMDAVVDYLPSPSERLSLRDKSKTAQIANNPDAPFIAQAFKVTHDGHRGRLVHLRAFSGTLESRKFPIWNCNKQIKERPSKWLHMLADDFYEQDCIECGDVFAMVGLRHTETGDTITVSKPGDDMPKLILEGMEVPPSVCSVAIETDSPSAQRDLDEFLDKRLAEDPSLKLEYDAQTGEMLLSGLGELHLESIVDRARMELPIELRVSRPRVAYRESVLDSTEHFKIYDARIGNAHLVAQLTISVRPAENKMAPNEVVVIGSRWSKEQQAALHDGVIAGLSRGVVLGLPTHGIYAEVRCDEEKSYEVAALRACGSAAAREAMSKANPVVVEPVMAVELDIPAQYQRDVVNALGHPVECRGRVVSAEPTAMGIRVCAQVPLDGMIGWAKKMRASCKGRGTFSMCLHAYEEVPHNIIDKVRQM